MKEVAAKATALKDDFLALIDEDSNAFNKIMAAFKMPKDTDEAKKARSAAIQDATKGAALVPFKVGQKANELFALAETVITKGNQNAITDGGSSRHECAGCRTGSLPQCEDQPGEHQGCPVRGRSEKENGGNRKRCGCPGKGTAGSGEAVKEGAVK